MKDRMPRDRNGQPGWVTSAWSFLFKPEDALRETGKRRQAQSVVALAFMLFVVSILAMVYFAAAAGRLDQNALILMAVSMLAAVCYALARTRHYRVGLVVLLTGMLLAAYAVPVFSPAEPNFFAPVALALIFLLPLGVFGTGEMLVVTTVTLFAALLAPVLIPSLAGASAWALTVQVFIMGIFASAAAAGRAAFEHARLAEANQVIEELQIKNTALREHAAERTRAIALTAEISRLISHMPDPEVLLPQAVDLIRERYGLYYAQIYLTDSQARGLQLRAGSGDVGEALLRVGHRLPIDLASINGQAALEQRPVVVQNTITTPTFRSHPLLPFTRAEIAVPLLSGARLLGVLDLQSREIGSLNEDNLAVFETLAGLISSALSGAESNAHLQAILAEQEARARLSVRAGWQAYLDAVEIKERITYSYEGEAPLPDVEHVPTGSPSVQTVPMLISGEPVGFFQFESNQPWTTEDTELVSAIAAQVAQQVENLRLLGQAEIYRKDAEEAVRRLTGQEWQSYLQESQEGELAFLYAEEQVQSLDSAGSGHSSAVEVDICVNEQSVGQMGIVGIDSLPEPDVDLIRTVSQQLASHLENIRLYTSANRELEERRRTEGQLEYQRRNLQAVLDNMAAGVFMVEVPSGRPILSNRRAEEILGRGISPDATEDDLNQVYQAYYYGMDILYPAQEMPVVAGMYGISAHIEDMEIRRPDGERMLLEVTGSPVYDSNGNVVASVVVFQDITLRKQAEDLITKRAAQLATVSEVATVISTISNPDEMLQTVVDMTRGSFDLYHAHVYLLDESGTTMVLSKGAGDVGRQMVYEGWQINLKTSKSIVSRAAHAHEGMIINDIALDPEFVGHPLLPNTRAEMAVPLMVGDQMLGVLEVLSDRVNNFSEEDILIETTLSSQVAVALQNARQFAETRASEMLVRTVIDATPDWIFIKDREHRYRLVNQGYANSLHLQPDEFIGKTDLDLGFPEELVKGNPEKGIRGFWADDMEVFETNEPQYYANDPAQIDGKIHVFDTYKTPLRDVNGIPWGVLAFARDVTNLHNLLQQNRTLYEGSRLLSRCATFEDSLRVLAENTILKQFDNVSLNLFDRPWKDTAPSMVRVASVWEKQPGSAMFKAGQVMALRTLPLIEQQAKNPSFVRGDLAHAAEVDEPVRLILQEQGLRAMVFFKVVVSGDFIGTIIATSTETHDFIEEEVRTFLSLAEQAVTVIQNLRLFEQVQQALEETAGLYAVNRRLIEAQDLSEMLQAVMEALNIPAFNRSVLYLFEYDNAGELESVLVRENVCTNDELPSFPTGKRFGREESRREFNRMRVFAPVFVEETDDQARAFRIASAVILPLWLGNHQLGAIALLTARPHHFTSEEKRISAPLAQQASVAIQNRLLLESAQARALREQNLREITARVRSSMDLETIMRTAVRELGTAMGRQVFIRMGSADELAEKPQGNGAQDGGSAGESSLIPGQEDHSHG